MLYSIKCFSSVGEGTWVQTQDSVLEAMPTRQSFTGDLHCCGVLGVYHVPHPQKRNWPGCPDPSDSLQEDFLGYRKPALAFPGSPQQAPLLAVGNLHQVCLAVITWMNGTITCQLPKIIKPPENPNLISKMLL